MESRVFCLRIKNTQRVLMVHKLRRSRTYPYILIEFKWIADRSRYFTRSCSKRRRINKDIHQLVILPFSKLSSWWFCPCSQGALIASRCRYCRSIWCNCSLLCRRYQLNPASASVHLRKLERFKICYLGFYCIPYLGWRGLSWSIADASADLSPTQQQNLLKNFIW